MIKAETEYRGRYLSTETEGPIFRGKESTASLVWPSETMTRTGYSSLF